MKVQLPQAHVGAVGTGVTVAASFGSRLVEFTPLLQGISLVVSILVGIATLGWYAYKFVTRK